MRRLLAWLPALALMGCTTSTPAPKVAAVSCNPYGSVQAPVSLSLAPGPVTSSVAEQTAVALFRACHSAVSVGQVASSSTSGTGMAAGPNDGQPVWLVQVDGTIVEASPGATYESHFLIEVNQATGVPTIVAQG